MHYALDPERHARIFGLVDPMDQSEEPGRSRRCKTCGGWHRLDKAWPHNCRPPAPPRSSLAAPQLAPSFGDGFIADPMTGEAVTSRNEKREYMARHDLVEYDAGVTNEGAQWVRERETADEIGQTIKRFMDTDQEYWTPEERGEVARTEELQTEGQDIDASVAEVVE